MNFRISPLVFGALAFGSAGLFVTAVPAGAAEAAASATSTPAVDSSQFEIPATDDGLPGSGPIRRYDWFKNLWKERRFGWSKRVQQDQNALVLLGDSITQGWGDVASSLPGIKTANRGISGDTTRGVLIRLKEDVLSLNPRGVVLLIGTNDLEEQAEPEVIAGNLKLIIAALREHNANMPVVLCRVMPSSAEKKRPADKIKKINQLYAEAMRDQPQVTMLDTWALFADAKGDAPAAEFPDLLHPNSLGYGRWLKALRPILETLALAPSWADDFAPEAGFASLHNGRDLSGWSYPEGTSLDGKTATDDGRFRSVNGRIVVTVARTQNDYKKLWTTKKFPKDFVLKLEFRASPNADSGIFVREPQLQCRDYLIAGPFTQLKHYRPLDWNEVVITVKGGLAHATCNGEVLVDAFTVPATGSIGFESDHGQMEYRRIRIKEQP
ncbi:MAG: GDSL-type esterase/lipase family protein [Opitutus sp.]